MAKSVRVKLDTKGVADLLKSKQVQADLSRRMSRVKSAAEASPELPSDVHVEQRDYVGHDRARSTLGIPAAIEARAGILSRALDAAGGE